MNNTDNKPARKQAIVLNHKRATRGCLSRAVEYGRLTVGQLKAALETRRWWCAFAMAPSALPTLSNLRPW